MQETFNILCVDDEQIVLDSIQKHLRRIEGVNVLTALSVNSALSVMEDNNIHIILTDLMMPDIDGLEFLKIIQSKNSDIIAVMITGYATINSALQAMQLGAFDYLAKPFTKEELVKIIHRALDMAKAGSQTGKESQASKPGKDSVGSVKGIGEHSWIMRHEDGSVLIGVKRPFLIDVGIIQNVYLPSPSDKLRQGSVYFQVFSSDYRSQSLLSPLSGTVISVNQKVVDSPAKALEDPYGEGWLIKIYPDNFEEEVKNICL
ncbi:MAG: response regulator [Chlorobi bacterium]|nr:response regulator [Chlorobiota bacterium]